MTAVPRPGALSMSSVPFTSRTRSRILARPRLLRFPGLSGSKPTPVVTDGEEQTAVHLP